MQRERMVKLLLSDFNKLLGWTYVDLEVVSINVIVRYSPGKCENIIGSCHIVMSFKPGV